VTRAVVVRHCARPEGADDNERLIKAVLGLPEFRIPTRVPELVSRSWAGAGPDLEGGRLRAGRIGG
jgi:hypothetical protein